MTPKEADPYDNTSVLLEAFVVRVSTAALAEVGVNPVGQAPEGISILKILACLSDPEKAQVISGAKVTGGHNQRSKVSSNDTIYLKKEQDIPISPEATKVKRQMVEINPYNSGRTFSIIPQIQSDENIQVEATFSYSGIVENEDQTIPPAKIGYDWTGVVTAYSGKPVITSAAQTDENVTFLILTATIQDSEEK